MNPSNITGCLARILAAQSGDPLASIVTAHAALATPRPRPPAGTSRLLPGPA